MMEKLLLENNVSPRTYQTKCNELSKWVEREKDDLMKTKKALERGWTKALEAMKRTQRDMQFAHRFMKSPNKDNFNVILKSYSSDDEFNNYGKLISSVKSESDTYSDQLSNSLSSSQQQINIPYENKNNIQIIDKYVIRD